MYKYNAPPYQQSEVLLSGQKTCTRRSFCNRTPQAWDKCAFYHGAKKIADICLAEPIYQERLDDMQSDLKAEGGLQASKQEFIDLFGGNPNQIVWVVRFELVQVITQPFQLICAIECGVRHLQ